MSDKLDISDPQKLLEEAFQALYESNFATELAEMAKQQDLYAYQKAWSEKFVQTFSFVRKYGAKATVCETSNLNVKMLGFDKYFACVEILGYSLTVHPPKVGSDTCECLEHHILEPNKILHLTLPEITIHLSQGLAKVNAENGKQLK